MPGLFGGLNMASSTPPPVNTAKKDTAPASMFSGLQMQAPTAAPDIFAQLNVKSQIGGKPPIES